MKIIELKENTFQLTMATSELALDSGKPWNYYYITVGGRRADTGKNILICGDGVINYMANAVSEKPIIIKYDDHDVFAYGRILAYVYEDENFKPQLIGNILKEEDIILNEQY